MPPELTKSLGGSISLASHLAASTPQCAQALSAELAQNKSADNAFPSSR
eukprot:CAMPEP_0171274588 /NCGR_PEP_ID=MMETSP0790-20130122/62888_1 /TAXON_ID=2925 /ORGANISM="Alexandrium catenella, Strain OF101" /LENGTH=48 /DNA_ID= /DNA_START= /DNA_END= /DNA_ORIENTATION=